MNPFERYNNLKKELSELGDEIENALECWVDVHAKEINPDNPDSVMFDCWTEFPDGILIEVFNHGCECFTVPVEELLEYFKK